MATNQADDQVPAPLRAWEPPLLVELPAVATALGPGTLDDADFLLT